jgi:hypothetical protein
MRPFVIALAILAISGGQSSAQQIPDKDADTKVARPAFESNTGPTVAIDSGHYNYHTINNRYGPFAALLRNDGFRVIDSTGPFSAERLASIKVLVVSNALSQTLAGNWNLPPSPAFGAAEIAAVKAWVREGGALLLIADHAPFAGSARELAAAFGFEFENGVAGRYLMNGRPDLFTKADGTLRDDVITRGRDADEAVGALRTFTGSAFRAPAAARPLIVLPPEFKVHACGLPCPPTAPKGDAGGHLQGAVLVEGRGRVAVFGEAAMFSAQIVPSAKPPFRMGFNASGAEQNKQFILNLLHWLVNVLPQYGVHGVLLTPQFQE